MMGKITFGKFKGSKENEVILEFDKHENPLLLVAELIACDKADGMHEEFKSSGLHYFIERY